jgi:hypothetical protein
VKGGLDERKRQDEADLVEADKAVRGSWVSGRDKILRRIVGGGG